MGLKGTSAGNVDPGRLDKRRVRDESGATHFGGPAHPGEEVLGKLETFFSKKNSTVKHEKTEKRV